MNLIFILSSFLFFPKHTCVQCKKTFKRKYNLERHYQVHNIEREKLKCHCGVKCVTKQSYRAHWKNSHPNKPFENPLEDVKETVNEIEFPLFSCDYCKKGFKRKDNLNVHMRSHFDKKKVKCSSCNKFFSKKWNLKEHIKRSEKCKRDQAVE